MKKLMLEFSDVAKIIVLVSDRAKTRSLIFQALSKSATSTTQSKSDWGPGRAEVRIDRRCFQGAQ